MRRDLILGLALLVFGTATTTSLADEPVGDATFTVMTYNIRHGRGMDEKVDLARQARVIGTQKPDFVALQEVDKNVMRSSVVDETVELGKMLEMVPAFGSFMDYQGGEYGLAILSKRPITKSEVIRLPRGNEPRVALATEVEVQDSESVLVVCVHFDWVRDDGHRYAQAKHLAEALDKVTIPYIVMGDFNDGPDSRTVRLFRDRAIEAVKPESDRMTFSSVRPRSEIDFIFAAPKDRWTATNTRVLDEPVASDHRPVVTTLTLRRQD